MADIQVRIKLNAGVDGDLISSVAFSQETNNVSKAVGSKTTKNNGQNLISWGEDGLIHISEDGYVGGADATLSEQGGYNGFVFGVVPENKMYSVEVTLEGSNIDSVTFYGDKNANQFPTRAIVNGEYIYSDDAEWTIIFPTSANSQTITFDMWNRANYNACFTHIGVFVNELTLDKKWIKSVESLSQSTGQPKEIYYGVTPSSGSLEILDINGEIKDYIQDGIFPYNNTPIDVELNNQKVQHHISIDSAYNNISNSLSINLGNKLSLWNSELSNAIIFSNTPQTAYQMLISSIGVTDDMLDTFISYENKTVKEYLDTIIIPYPEMPQQTKRQVADKFCQLAQLQVIENDSGEIKFIPARPKMAENINSNVIYIPKSKQFSSLGYDIIVKNKIDSVYINENNIIANNEQFGERQTINMEEELSEPIVIEYLSGAKGTISEYSLVYNTDKNAFNGNTTIVSEPQSFIENGEEFRFTTYYYKTHIVFNMTQYKLNSNYTNDVKFYISYNKKGQNKNNQDVTIAPYKTVREDITLNIANKGISNSISQMNKDYIKIENLIATQKELSFDLYTVKERVDNIGNLRVYATYPIDITIGFVGNHYTIEHNSEYNGEDFEISGNELIQTGTVIRNDKIINIIKSYIEEDYSDGIMVGNISVSCSDYYYINGNKAKDWSLGNILRVGDFVQIEGNDTIWRVTGRNFRKVGVPMIDLELQELKFDKYILLETSYTENVTYEMSSGSGVLDVTWYKNMTFDKETGFVTLSDTANQSDYYEGATLYWASDTVTKTFDKIELTSNFTDANRLTCTANKWSYKVISTLD